MLNYYISHQPKITRAFHNNVEAHADRKEKTDRIIACSPNNEGDAGGADARLSFNALVRYILLGAKFLELMEVYG